MRIISTLIIFVSLIILVAFACINSQLITFNYFFGIIKLPLSVLIGLSFASGCLISLIFTVKLMIINKINHLKLYRLTRRHKLISQSSKKPTMHD